MDVNILLVKLARRRLMKYAKLRGRVKERGMTESELANQINLSPSSLSSRLSGKVDWTLPEVRAVCDVLCIPIEDVGLYFFT